MVIHYSPEPQRDSEENFAVENAGVMIMENESSEDDEIIMEGVGNNGAEDVPFGYELLPQEVPTANNEDGVASGGRDDNNQAPPPPPTVRDDAEDNDYGEVMPMAPECANKTRPDIEINAEEVRAAMRNVTLPPSSFPPWAASIPESQWTQFLFMRLTSNVRLNLDLHPPHL